MDLVPGETYRIVGDFRSVTGPGSFPGQIAFGIDLDGVEIATKPLPNPINTWTPFSVTFTATASTHTVRFRGEINGTDGDIGIDNIRIDGTAKTYNCYTRGVHNITLVVVDAYGNTSTCNTTATVQSVVNPCPFTLEVAGPETILTNESGEQITTSTENEIGYEVTLYPNPSDGRFTLQLSDMPRENTELRILNSLGQVIYTSPIMSQVMSYDFSYLRAGTYYVQLISDKGNLTKQIIITQKY
jgi:hypothetical protein